MPVESTGLTVWLLQATVMLAAGWLVHFLLGGANPRWRVLLWRFVSVGVLLAPLLSLLVPRYGLNVQGALDLPAVHTLREVVLEGRGRHGPEMIHWLLFAWLVVAMLMSARLVLARRWLARMVAESTAAPARLRRMLDEVAGELGLRGEVELRVAPRAGTPFLFGLASPVIVLPRNMAGDAPDNVFRGVLAHELAHLRSRDIWWMMLLQGIGIILWFHPLVWRVATAHRLACEHVCDSVASARAGGARAYSGALAGVMLESLREGRLTHAAGAALVRRSEIIRRLEAVRRRVYPGSLDRGELMAFAVVALACLGAVSALDVAWDTELVTPTRARDTGEWLQVAEVMPKFRSIPPRPSFPGSLAGREIEGVTRIEFFVGSDGLVDGQRTRIDQSSGYEELDRLALEWAKRIEFTPAMNDGEPVPMRVRVPVQWKSR